ncbi:MAG: hypothetical protein U0P45_10975 [Acidimicrobiales bacterium]
MAFRRRAIASLACSSVLVIGLVACQGQVPGTSCPMFPSDSHWHAKVTALPVLSNSSSLVSSVGASAPLKADFGSGLWDGGPIGIPYVVVPGSQAKVPVTFGYADESDPGPYPIPADPPIEGGANSTGDRHVLIVDKGAPPLRALRRPSLLGGPVERRLRCHGTSGRTRCARRAGRRPTPQACRSCPASSATTRSPRARSTTRSA